MKIQISQRQLSLLTANLTIASGLVVLPQSLIDLALQNTWTVIFLLFLYVVFLISIALFGVGKLNDFALKPKQKKTKLLAFLMVIFIFHIIIRDLRILTGFIEVTLLPLTPLFIITVLIIGTSLYIAWAGLEVIARFNELAFSLFILVVLFIPLSLLEKFDLENFEPVLGLQVIPSLFQSSYVGLAWMGEVIIVFLILGAAKSIKETRKSMLWGAGIGIGLLFILIFCQIAVLGAEIVRYSTYPSYTLVQEIRLTEFMDRLDFILVALYFPITFSKLAFLLYGLNFSMNLLFNSDNKVTLIPQAIAIGILSILLFENKTIVYEFQIHTWASLGLFLQLLIAAVMFFIIGSQKQSKKKNKNDQARTLN
ncbi:endospore germination permease [Alkalihalobacillus sp. MEB130]|uniref:GerAB/ArcD/ProY family transporter n=1 Tax=Alkalihalobacillus sp. MEB130 TaxID=2976704 RepID=UPI0028DDCB29|nr:endospore germination permease [Alkalihalobacillus sp. MEB130]MDT8861189.1 endospore germination permease [Alkalihalobacillus sp. MEB130]